MWLLGEGRHADALALAQRAIDGEPREALFHTLRGEVLEAMHRTGESMAAYSEAIHLYDGNFMPRLRRGLLLRRDLRHASARTDLERSVALLPTAPALNALGRYSLDAGDRRRAIGYFEDAARSDSTDGRSAQHSLLRLQLPEDPGRYLRVRALLDGWDRVVLEVTNPTVVAVRGVAVAVTMPTVDGPRQQIVSGGDVVIPAGGRSTLHTNLGSLPEGMTLDSVQATVVRAQVVD